MPTLTTPAIYQNGVVIPKTRPHFSDPDEVVVTFTKSDDKKKGNAREFLALLEEFRGTLPKDFPDGAEYISKLRKEMGKEWEEWLARP